MRPKITHPTPDDQEYRPRSHSLTNRSTSKQHLILRSRAKFPSKTLSTIPDSVSGDSSGDFEVKPVEENNDSNVPRLAERLIGLDRLDIGAIQLIRRRIGCER